jgi:anti-sigma factor ChrR (cupin superfamily)
MGFSLVDWQAWRAAGQNSAQKLQQSRSGRKVPKHKHHKIEEITPILSAQPQKD